MLETQVTKVGANVKKLYSDFVRELLLPLEVPGESQAWADAQARLKPPAIAGGEESAPGGDQPGAEEEEGEMVDGEGGGQERDSKAQAEEDAQVIGVGFGFGWESLLSFCVGNVVSWGVGKTS